MRGASIALALLSITFSRSASAYPQWQFSSGTSRCSQCHFNPAGGGLINEYGRDAAGEELSTWQGNGAFLHGSVELPSRLALGFDGRGAFAAQSGAPTEGASSAIFPMQADAYARLAFADAWSASVTAGVRGQARSAGGELGGDNYQPRNLSRFVSREHYLMYRPAALGPYVRAGRFFAPYGLRLAEHNSYVRRDLGFALLQETYGLSGGMLASNWEAHVTAFVPDFIARFGLQESGVAAMYERRFLDAFAAGAQARAAFGDGQNRYNVGATGKAWLAPVRTLFMAEVDLTYALYGAAPATTDFVGFFGATFFPLRGLWTGVYLERSQRTIQLDDSVNGFTGQINWFPYPHFEVDLLGRLGVPRGQPSEKQALVMVHYYL